MGTRATKGETRSTTEFDILGRKLDRTPPPTTEKDVVFRTFMHYTDRNARDTMLNGWVTTG